MFVLSRSAIVEACDRRTLTLRFPGNQPCCGCAVGQACATRSVSSGLRYVAVPPDLHTGTGANLLVQIEGRVLGRIALLCYVVPPLLLVCGASLGAMLPYFSGESGAIFGALAGLALGGMLLRLYDSRHRTGLWRVEPQPVGSSAAMR
jgi:positive regulator of sigma E activity